MVTLLVSSRKNPPTTSAMRLGQRLKAVRERAGKTQQQVADALGRDHKTVSAYENGRAVIRTDQLDTWANALGVTVSDLTIGLGLCPDPTWSMRDALRSHVPEDAIERYVREWADDPIEDQQAAARAIIADYQRVQREASDEIFSRHRRGRPAS